MGTPGKALRDDIPPNEMIEIIYECFGCIKDIANKIGYTRKAIYDYFDEYPELMEERKKAQVRYRDAGIENSESVMDKLLNILDDDPQYAFKAAQYILSKSPESPYRDKPVSEDKEAEETERFINRLDKLTEEKVARDKSK